MSTNNGPCKVKDCNNNDSNKHKFRKFTQLSKEKAIRTNTYQNYNYLQIGDQFCFSHYLLIVEADRNKNKKRKSEEFNEINIRDDNDDNNNMAEKREKLQKISHYYFWFFVIIDLRTN